MGRKESNKKNCMSYCSTIYLSAHPLQLQDRNGGLPKNRQEASRWFYKHYNAILCMLHSKIDRILHVHMLIFK